MPPIKEAASKCCPGLQGAGEGVAVVTSVGFVEVVFSASVVTSGAAVLGEASVDAAGSVTLSGVVMSVTFTVVAGFSVVPLAVVISGGVIVVASETGQKKFSHGWLLPDTLPNTNVLPCLAHQSMCQNRYQLLIQNLNWYKRDLETADWPVLTTLKFP